MYKIEKREIASLHPHPRNKEIYGTLDVSDLVDRIKITERIEAIKITPEGKILSGHRRTKAAEECGYTEIDCIIVDDLDPNQQLELLLDENCYREKNNFQKIKEGIAYHEIESKKSEQRKIESGRKNLGLTVVENDTTTDESNNNEKGKTRDIVGKKVNVSGKTFEKGLKIVGRINEETDLEIKTFLSDQANRSVDSTFKLVNKSSEFIKKVKDEFDSKGGFIKRIIRKIEMDVNVEKQHINPNNLYSMLFMVLKQTKTNLKKLFDIPISKITNDNSIFYVWVIPSMVEQIIKVLNTWGYSFLMCDSWEGKDVEKRDPFTGDGIQILCVFTKGNMDMKFLTKMFYRLKKDQIDPFLNFDQLKLLIIEDYAKKKKISFDCEDTCEIWGQ
jgi:ParB-like chromosome segregation protein Spo0J